MSSITIELVSLNGFLVGKTASCRWNLAMLGIGPIVDDGRNGASLKRARRALSKAFGDDFTLSKVRNVRAVALPTEREREALGKAIGIAA